MTSAECFFYEQGVLYTFIYELDSDAEADNNISNSPQQSQQQPLKVSSL